MLLNVRLTCFLYPIKKHESNMNPNGVNPNKKTDHMGLTHGPSYIMGGRLYLDACGLDGKRIEKVICFFQPE